MTERNQADDAWSVHQALVLHENAHLDLKGNPQWNALRDAAYQRLQAAMGKAP